MSKSVYLVSSIRKQSYKIKFLSFMKEIKGPDLACYSLLIHMSCIPES